jgi:hypothetical protein
LNFHSVNLKKNHMPILCFADEAYCTSTMHALAKIK